MNTLDADFQRKCSDFVHTHVYMCMTQIVDALNKARDSLGEWEEEISELMDGRIDWEEAARDDGWKPAPDGSFFKEPDEPQYHLSINLDERGMLSVSVHRLDDPWQEADGECVWSFEGTADEAAEYDGGDSLDMRDTDELLEVLKTQGVLPKTAELSLSGEDGFQTSDASSWQELVEEENIDYDYYRSEPYEFWAVSDYLSYALKKRGETVVDLLGVTIWGRCTTGQAISIDGVIEEIVSALN